VLELTHLLKVIWAISAMSEPTGPHGSLLVAVAVSRSPLHVLQLLTIADLDLDGRIALGDVLHTPHNFRHGSDGEQRSAVLRGAPLLKWSSGIALCRGSVEHAVRPANAMCDVGVAAVGMMQAVLGRVCELAKRARPMRR
jgi:hypothetical protein